jgi:hypothetical protein
MRESDLQYLSGRSDYEGSSLISPSESTWNAPVFVASFSSIDP